MISDRILHPKTVTETKNRPGPESTALQLDFKTRSVGLMMFYGFHPSELGKFGDANHVDMDSAERTKLSTAC